MAYSAASIANAFLTRAFADRHTIVSPMKIQKLAYLAHGYFLAETGQPLLDELFEAWKFGPVLPSLYHECKKFGQGSINDYIHDYDFATGRSLPAPMPDDKIANEIVEFVWSIYGKMNALDLSDWTHARGGPWDKTTHGGTNIPRNQIIPNALITAYFRENFDDNFFPAQASEAARCE
jgi:uncharacterized phage-associated protein